MYHIAVKYVYILYYLYTIPRLYYLYTILQVQYGTGSPGMPHVFIPLWPMRLVCAVTVHRTWYCSCSYVTARS
jgi:hypothetical protein